MRSSVAVRYARLVALLGRHRRLAWSLLLLLLVGVLYLHARSVRDASIEELAINLDLGLDVTQADIDSWAASRRAHAELLARVVAEPRAAAAHDGLLRALLAGDGYQGAWINDAAGKAILGESVPSTGAYLDFSAPILDAGKPHGTIVLRAAPNDSTFPNLNPTRVSNRTARTTLLARVGDSVRVVATRSHSSNSSLPRVLPFAAMPAHVRAAFAGQRSRGEGTGLFGQHVGYAARPALAPGWVLVREMETQEFEELLRVPILLQALVFGALAVLVAFLIANRTRAAAARRERELAQLRTEFMASASHELRTPLTQIRMFSELLRTGGLRTPEDKDRALRAIEKESQRLSTLVDNLLNFAELRRSAEHPIATPSTDIAEEARQVIADFEPLINERRVSIVERLEPGLNARIDSPAFRQILINFLENALKYGPHGQTVTVRANAIGSQLQLAVEDQGPGIPAAERSSVWQAFYRREAAVASRENGSGIGLAVVRDLVLQCGGSVRVEEAPSGGARFVAEFPGAETAR